MQVRPTSILQIKMHQTPVLPTVLYGWSAWFVILSEKQRPRV